MLNRKLLQIINELTKKEMLGFIHFAQNPMFNSQKSTALLLEGIYPFYPNISIAEKDIESLYQKIFPNKVFKEIRFKQVQTAAYQLSLEYLAHLNLFSRPKEIEVHTHSILKERLPIHYNKYLNKPSNRQEDVLNEQDLLIDFKKRDLENRYLVEEIRKKGRKLELNTQPTLESLSASFIISYLRYACQELNLKNLKDSDKAFPFLDAIWSSLESFPLTKYPVVHLYVNTYKLLLEPDEVQFEKLKALLNKYAQVLEKEDAYELYIYAQNYCIRSFNNGNQEALASLFDLYKDTLDKEIIINKGELSPWDYKNIVFVGLRLKAYDWTTEFLDEYKRKLPAHERENAYTYNLARVHFAQENYNEVLALLNEVEYNDIFYQLDAKSTLIKTFYELEELDAMYSLMDSFKILLLRTKKISASYKALYKNLISMTKKISRTRSSDKIRLEQLSLQIENKAIADKAWVKAKLAELNQA